MTGRSDDMIKVKGVNVFPAAVKGIIQSYTPETTGEFRIVLPHPGPSYGENLTIKVEYGEQLKNKDRPILAEKLKTTIKEKLVFSPTIEWIAAETLERSQYEVKYFEKAFDEKSPKKPTSI